MSLKDFYKSSLSLNTDLYELTMAYGYWKNQLTEHHAAFNLFFRKHPFHGSFAIAAGLANVLEYLENFHFSKRDLDYLSTLKNSKNTPLFDEGFLKYLENLKLRVNVDAMPEGTPVFPQEPILRVYGPILEAQILESALLNFVNFQSLIATKSFRICNAAEEDEVVEFGLRRAQGIDGGLSGARAAYIGGCHSTSNVLAGQEYGIPVQGTHAHSWIMAHENELDSFKSFAKALPDSCIFLVDTYNTFEGVKNAILVGKELREKGHEMIGVRIDSGDLAHLSIEVRKMLDDAGFEKAKIMASNELDEFIIRDLKLQGAKIDLWGVGTNLITAKDQPALDGVYKLSAVKAPGQDWTYRLKVSEQTVKTTNPGVLQVKRFFLEDRECMDVIYDEFLGLSDKNSSFSIMDPARKNIIHSEWESRDLLIPVMKEGKIIYNTPSIHEARSYCKQQTARFHKAHLRFLNPHLYPVGIDHGLFDVKMRLMEEVGS